MTTANPDHPPYDNDAILSANFPERVRLVCRTWASQINPNSPALIAMYWAKYLFGFIGGWAFFVSFSAGYPGFGSPLEWAFMGVAFQKALAWAIFYELCGFGCSWGPMSSRISPMTLGFRHFLRPGTTKLPLFAGIPIFGGNTRSYFDVGLYAANQLCLLYALVQPEITPALLMPSFILIPLMGLTDKTLFLAARSEHYYVALVCLTVASGDALWISACKMVWCAVWFWAATSKVNHHFPYVIMFMMNNGPFFPSFLKKYLFISFPDDLRPSKMATWMSHMGTLTEYSIPILLLLSPDPLLTLLVMCLALSFHGYIAFNCPAGMPIEWNIVMVYGGFFLFVFNPGASVTALAVMPGLVAFLVLTLVVQQLVGNFFPQHVSFLMSMRYYAGNWAYNIWFFRGDSVEKIKKLKLASGTLQEQLEGVMPKDAPAGTVETTLAMSMAMRFMHLQGRPMFEALPRAVDNLENYERHEGEVIGGQILGWNFGDGHLNGKHLLKSIQPQCEFEEGELRVVSVESQPLFGGTMKWEIHDAKTGLVDQGTTVMAPMRELQPWPVGEHAEAFLRGRSD